MSFLRSVESRALAWRVKRSSIPGSENRPQLLLSRVVYRNNWGRFSDPGIDDLFTRQARALDSTERKKLINEIEKIVLGHVYYIPGIWWARSVVHWAKVKNYVAPPNHYSNQKLQDVWLSED